MMKRLTLILSCVLSMVLLTSCDDGDIYDKEVVYNVSGRTAKLTGHLEGLSHWPTSHYIALAGFVKDNDYIEYKKSAEIKDGILKTACAFANNYMNREIGLIFVGIEEVDDNETGEKAVPVRPITGI